MNLSFHSPSPWPTDEAIRQELADQAIARAPAVHDRLQSIVQAAATFYHTPIAAVSIVDKDRQWFAASTGLDVGETARATSFCGHAMLQPSAMLIVPDTIEDGRFAGNPLVLFDPHIRFYAGAPLVDADGRAIGALCIIDRAARGNDADYTELRLLAGEAAQLLFS